MRYILLGYVFLAVGTFAPTASAAGAVRSPRSVEIISMSAVAPREQSSPARATPDGPQDAKTLAASPGPRAFRTHDLSRRWVAFEMANAFAGMPGTASASADNNVDPFARSGSAPALPSLPSAVETASQAVTIPGWMRGDVAFAAVPTGFSSGCGPGTYRPAGFLDQRAEDRRSGYYAMMSTIACDYGIPVGLFDAMIIRESRYDAGIYSYKRAFGLTQLMPGTAAGLGVDRFDVEQNLRGGARYLRRQLDSFGQVHLALAAYNAGPARVRNGQVPRIAETQAYVDNVLLNWRRLTGSASFSVVQPSTAPVRNGRLATVLSY